MDYKIVIAITELNRPEHIKLAIRQHDLFLPDNTIVNVVNGKDGIATAKNECIKLLQDCDYLFLFDDDVFPIKAGWAEYFIEAHKRTGNHHFLYLNRIHDKLETNDGIDIYKECGGCFMFLTKEVIQKVGGFYKGYGKYGYEHAGYTHRIFNSGLNPMGKYLCPSKANEYLFAFDFDVNTYGINHKPSLSFKQSLMSCTANEVHYREDIKEVFRPI